MGRRDLGEALAAQLFERLRSLVEAGEIHAAEYRRRLRELHVAIVDDLDVVAPRVAEAQAAAGLATSAPAATAAAQASSIVDDEPEVALFVDAAAAALGEGEELIAEVDEGHPGDAAAELDREDRAVEGERLLERRRPRAPRG